MENKEKNIKETVGQLGKVAFAIMALSGYLMGLESRGVSDTILIIIICVVFFFYLLHTILSITVQ